ncbi:head decoration protein [Acetobacter sp. TBRC 12305]|uniref:Head decoration protein n=1 Tax=Acetobacter garciniae TaxID=2817435 RepID=A0A939HKS3_9PROT|nr:head decoration protein [Acetobacter garciniae]MBO1325307.1 head decoration protein [Acetobacter garciniae]MBX0344721.1 head decoration protein [Acetobacter garciniae]
MSYGINPMSQQVVFVPDQLIAGNLKLVTSTVTFASGNTLVRGQVVGRVTASGDYIPSVATATDGSQVPCGIVVDTVDASAAAAQGAIYEMGEFNSNYMTFDASWTLAALTQALRQFSIFVKTGLSNAIV